MDKTPTAPRPQQLLVHGLVWVLCCAGIGAALYLGRNLPPPPVAPPPMARPPAPTDLVAVPWRAFLGNPAGFLGRLLLQVAVILAATRSVGALFRRLGLPAVVGEITAGILLGPSLLGWLWPGGFAFIFPGASLDVLKPLSQIGVAVFMFTVGLELEVGDLRQRARSAFLISQTGIAVPFLFGVVAALFLYPAYAGPGAAFASFALFMGIAMSITAFPVLARILEERGMARTPLGAAAVTCAAVGDASAWAILALVVAFARAQALASIFLRFGLLAIFVALMLGVVRRYLPRCLGLDRLAAGAPRPRIALAALAFMAASALVTDILGIHALFGAFLAGAIMPRQEAFRRYLSDRVESLTQVVLLPLFFAFSGLRTHIGLLDHTAAWLVVLAIVVTATAGKLGSSMGAARLSGMGWNDAFAFGALMNTRGLMELIALNVGYDLGVLPPPIFAMLVVMALVTTFLTGPLLDLAGRLKAGGGSRPAAVQDP